MSARGGLGLAVLLVAAPGAARGQVGEQPAPRAGDRVGVHVVQPRENWQTITERYLGTSALWPENWRLNPGLADPHLLRPGQRIRVILHREIPHRSADLRRVERRVDKKLEPEPWEAAHIGDRLKERDGLRTHERSSGELVFDDGSRLVVTEQSLLFLREARRDLAGVSRESVEIVEGQADVEVRPATRPARIEIVMGDATARPEPVGGAAATARTRRAGQGDAQVMVYGGRSSVAAAGATVSVPQGMGTSVPPGAPPSPPERLLAAPSPVSPAAGSRWDFANPLFEWRPGKDALSYTVEACLDDDCGRLALRATGITGASWVPERLPVGDLYWRVTAVARSGLDGYPSRAVPLTITSDRRDVEPPVVAVAVEGRGLVESATVARLGAGAALRFVARDDASGVARVRYRWDEGGWREYGSPVRVPAGGGAHVLHVEAVDRLGRTSALPPITVDLDETAPEAPEPVGGARP